MNYYYFRPELAGSEEQQCFSMQRVVRFSDVDHPVFLNISTLPRSSSLPLHHLLQYQLLHQHHHLNQPHLHHDTYTNERRGFNLTYEMRQLGDPEPAVDGLDMAHQEHCNYNGVPVLHQLSPRKFRFSCDCTEGATGRQCQVGGLCANGDPRSWCSDHGECRYVAGESICVCDQGYHGTLCQYHYTTIPSSDQTCGRLLRCQHNCHLRVEWQVKLVFCSCSAGYVSINTTHCVALEDWDVTVRLEMPGEPLNTEEAINKTLEVVSTIGEVAQASNISVNTRAGVVQVEVSVVGTEAAHLLTSDTLWQREFGAVKVTTSRIPRLSVGPVSAEWASGSALALTCPVYGGSNLKVRWYKDDTLVYSHSVHACWSEEGTWRVKVMAKKGSADHECTIMMWILQPQVEDRGTYVCQVADRGYLDSQMVRAGSNQSLQLDITRVITVTQGEDVEIECTTKNRAWADPHHYTVHWLLHPAHAYTHTSSTPIHRRGFTLTIFNVTRSVTVTCIMVEEQGVMWTPVDVDGEVANTSAVVHVVTSPALACHNDYAYGVTWSLTPVHERDEVPCPKGYQGSGATRYCRILSEHPDSSPSVWQDPTLTTPSGSSHSQPSWDIPEFSECIYQPLKYTTTPLYLYTRGFRSLPEDLEGLAKNILKILQERVSPVLPGEGASIVHILEMLGATEQIISLHTFLSILETVVSQKKTLSFTTTWRMLEISRRHLRTVVVSSSTQGENVWLPHLVGRVTHLNQEDHVVTTDCQPRREAVPLLSVRVEVSFDDTQARTMTLKELQQREEQEEAAPVEVKGPQQQQQYKQQVSVGIVIFLRPENFPYHQRETLREDTKEPILVEAALVEVVEHRHIVSTDSPRSTALPRSTVSPWKKASTSNNTASTRKATDAHIIPTNFANSKLVSYLTYSSCPVQREATRVPACGLGWLEEGTLSWDLSPCSLLESGEGNNSDHQDNSTSGGRCVCLCRGEGLFTLLLVSPTLPEITHQRDSGAHERQGEASVAGSCVLSAAVTAVCLLLLLPRASLTTVQLRLLKCLALTLFNLTFAVFVVWNTSQVVVGVRAVGSSCLVLCMGVGVSQQMALHQHLAVTTHTTPMSPTHTVTFAVIAVSCTVGLAVWAAEHLYQYPQGLPWLPLGDAWTLTAGVLGSMMAVFLLWVALARHNLKHLALIKAASPDHRSLTLVCGRVKQLAMVVAGEWTLVSASLIQHHHLGRYFFCLVTLTQSVVILVMYMCSSDDASGLHCYCPLTHTSQQSSQDEHEEFKIEDEDGRGKGCMDGLLGCRIPSVRTYESVPEGRSGLKDYLSEFRARGGSFWSQTTTTIMLPDNGELLHSPTDYAGPFSHRLDLDRKTRLPLYARGGNCSVTIGAKRPKNLFLWGTNLMCGEETTSPQDILNPSTMIYEEMDARMLEKRRNLSFNVHHPVIHELPKVMHPGSTLRPVAHHSHLDSSTSSKYLNMSIPKNKNFSKGANIKSTKHNKNIKARRYVNQETDNPRSSEVITDEMHCEPSKSEPCYANVGMTNTCRSDCVGVMNMYKDGNVGVTSTCNDGSVGVTRNCNDGSVEEMSTCKDSSVGMTSTCEDGNVEVTNTCKDNIGQRNTITDHGYLPMNIREKIQRKQTQHLKKIHDNSTLQKHKVQTVVNTLMKWRHDVSQEERICNPVHLEPQTKMIHSWQGSLAKGDVSDNQEISTFLDGPNVGQDNQSQNEREPSAANSKTV